MSVFDTLRRRRIFPWLGAYIAGGFLMLEGVDQLVGNSMLPALAYRIALVFYLFGIPGTSVLAWFHGEKGAQKPPRREIWMEGVLVVAAIGVSTLLVRNDRARAANIEFASQLGLDSQGLVVRYFEDLSAEGELEYVADGLTEALIDRLSRVRSLDVISSNGVAPYRGREITSDSLARTFGVGSVIEGSVEAVGDRVRVITRLVDGFSGAGIERAQHELPIADFLTLRDSVAETMAIFLRQRLGEEVRLRESRAGTANVDAWSLVQRAEGLRKQASAQEDGHAIDDALVTLAAMDSILALAEAVDPDWVRPATLRANSAFRRGYVRAALLGDFDGGARELRSGLPHAERALAIDANDPEALEARGTLRYTLWLLDAVDDADEAEQLFESARADLESAVEANPAYAEAWSMLSHLHMQRADNAAVIIAAQRAYEEDAFLDNADQILNRLFWANYDLEQFNDAEKRCAAGRRRFPDDGLFVECHLWLMLAPSHEADADSAWALHGALLQNTAATDRAFQERLGYLLVGGALRRTGLLDSASVVLARGRGNEQLDPTEMLVVQEARIRAATGDADGAMDLLKRYVAANPAHSFEVGGQIHWMWRSLRDRPDFRTFLTHN